MHKINFIGRDKEIIVSRLTQLIADRSCGFERNLVPDQ